MNETGLEYSLASLREVIFPLLDLVGARSVVEVGAAAGSFTAELLGWSDTGGAEITAVDSAPTPELRALAARDSRLRLVEAMSVDALPALAPADVYVLDGDHNYFTVSEELRLINCRGHGSWSFPLVLLHDVCWPWGRRDCYYDREALGGDACLPSMPGEQFGAWGRANLANSGIYVATREGGPQNGVLTAAEDFAARRPNLRLAVIPAFHGLGVIYPQDAEWSVSAENFVKAWDRNPLLARLEADRVEKINAMAELAVDNAATWAEGVRHARELEHGWKQSADRVLELENQLAALYEAHAQPGSNSPSRLT